MKPQDAAALWEANAEAWTQLVRAGRDVYRDLLNTPAMLAMLPPVAGLAGLDIGCGEGENTRQMARLGARMHAIDIAPTFIRHARAAEAKEPAGIEYSVGDGMNLPYPDESFDFAVAFMSMMDMPDQARALTESQRVLKPDGFLQFSILHPCFVPPHRKVLREANGDVRAIEIARYFDRVDGDVETWCFSSLTPEERQGLEPFKVPRFHRTLSEWVQMIVASGLLIEKMQEPSASQEMAIEHPMLADTRAAGIFLHIRALKPRSRVI
jgi:ubiquinone/menaquinone biosynthesis C-methylase UbiE